MRRWGVRIAVFLLIGALLNVLVAWSCALWAPMAERWSVTWDGPDYGEGRGAVPDDAYELLLERWPSLAGDGGLFNNHASMRGLGGPGTSTVVGTLLLPPTPMDPDVVVDVACGWPRTAFVCRGVRHGWRGTGLAWRGGIEAPAFLRPGVLEIGAFAAPSVRPLPLRVEASGFALNTVCYAAALGVLIGGGRTLRARRRVRRGRCGPCGYDVRRLGPGRCPECGAPVSPRRTPDAECGRAVALARRAGELVEDLAPSVAALAAGGAAAALVVAWACALLSPATGEWVASRELSARGELWAYGPQARARRALRRFGLLEPRWPPEPSPGEPRQIIDIVYAERGPGQDVLVAMRDWRARSIDVEARAGWPLRCLGCGGSVDEAGAAVFEGAWERPAWADRPLLARSGRWLVATRPVPAKVLWWGLAANGAFFGLVFAMAAAGLRLVRRRAGAWA